MSDLPESPDPAVIIPLLFLFGMLPVGVVMLTSYTKIVVVFSLLRNALGLQQVPPPTVTNGLALVLTWYVMYPVGMEVMQLTQERQLQRGVTQTQAQERPLAGIGTLELVQIAKEPLRAFLDKHVSDRERAFFADAARRLMPPENGRSVDTRDFVVLVPAFAVSQLTEAFVIGVLIALPFVVVDIVVANVLMALGMQMMSPAMISLPIKLLLFVVLDGWSRLAHALVLSYH